MDKKSENKKQKFKRIANIRTNNVLKALRSLSNLSNTRNYEFTKADVAKIYHALNNEVRIGKAMFDKSLKNNQFKL